MSTNNRRPDVSGPARLLYLNPQRHDYLHAHLIEGLLDATQVLLSCTTEGNFGARAQINVPECELEGQITSGCFDAVIVGTEGKKSDLSAGHLRLADVALRSSRPVAIVDSGDLGSLRRHRLPYHRAAVLVKRELYKQSDSVSVLIANLFKRTMDSGVENQFRAHPFVRFPNIQCNLRARPTVVAPSRRTLSWRVPLSVYCEPIGVLERIIQEPNEQPARRVTCTLTPNTEARRILRRHLANNPNVDSSIINPSDSDVGNLVASGEVSSLRPYDHVHNTNYLRHLNHHIASISFPGAGFDSARFWEILASGSLLISKRISLDLPVPLHEGTHYLGFDSLTELTDAVNFAVSDSPEVHKIRLAGWHLAEREYSSAAAASRLLGHLASIRSIG